MRGKNAIIVILMIFAVSVISGCQTAPKKLQEEVGGIKTRVETLESKVDTIEAKQTEAEQAQYTQEAERMAGTNISVKPRFKGKEDTKTIQAALKNAGFYDGNIDGISGRKTRRAIREFQKANNLSADGIVGKKTWEVLSKYAEGPGRVEEGATK